jgi:hypothetical protein
MPARGAIIPSRRRIAIHYLPKRALRHFRIVSLSPVDGGVRKWDLLQIVSFSYSSVPSTGAIASHLRRTVAGIINRAAGCLAGAVRCAFVEETRLIHLIPLIPLIAFRRPSGKKMRAIHPGVSVARRHERGVWRARSGADRSATAIPSRQQACALLTESSVFSFRLFCPDRERRFT